MISKELVCEIDSRDLNPETLRIKSEGNTLFINGLGVNIYQFAHECKEWAFHKGYEVSSRILSNDGIGIGNSYITKCENEQEEVLNIFNCDSEYESIFQACEWIMENKDAD